MTNVVLSLPSGLHHWAEEQAANNDFQSVCDYVESLLLKEQRELESLAEFDRLVQEGEDSGVSQRSMDEILADARQQARARSNGRI